MWWQELRAEDAICLVNHDSHRLINADVKELVAGAQEMGMDAFMEMIGYRPAEALAVAA